MRLGKQMRLILENMHKEKDSVRRESTIIRAIFNLPAPRSWDKESNITPTMRASVSRSLRILKENDLVFTHFFRYRYTFKRRYGKHELWGKRFYLIGWYEGDIERGELKLLDEEKHRDWMSKPWYGITDKGIALIDGLNANNLRHLASDVNVNNSPQLRPDINVKEVEA